MEEIKVIREFIELAYGNYIGLHKSKIELLTLLKEKEEAINYTHCCAELKDKEVPTFSEWAKTLKFSSNGIKLYKGQELYNDELIEVYKKEINPLSL